MTATELTRTQVEPMRRYIDRRQGKPPSAAELQRIERAQMKRVLKQRSAD